MTTPVLAAVEFARRAAELMARLAAIQADTLAFALDVETEADNCLREIPPSEARDAFIGSLNALRTALVAATAVSLPEEQG